MSDHFSLHNYQLRGVQHLQSNPRAALFWDVGTGKSAVTLSALTSDHLPALICAPKRVAEHTWPAELAKWRPDLSTAYAIGDPAARRIAFRRRADVTIIGRDVLADAPTDRYRTLILDESHGFRHRASQRVKAARPLAQHATYVWELTGTPSPRSLEDLWAQVYLLDGGERLGRTLTGFRNRYFRPGRTIQGHIVTEWIPRDEADGRIHDLLADICLSQKPLEHLMPKVTHNRIVVDLPPAQRKQYRQLVRDLVVHLDLLGVVTAANAAVVTSKLSQLTAGFLYNETRQTLWLHDAKLDALEEVVEATGSPVLISYRFKAEAAAIQKRFPEARTVDEKGVLDAWNRGEVPLLLGHPASAGAGLNLQAGGHTLVWESLSWDSEHKQQMDGRLARQGQAHPVVINSLICENTIDEVIESRLAGKIATQDALLHALKGL